MIMTLMNHCGIISHASDASWESGTSVTEDTGLPALPPKQFGQSTVAASLPALSFLPPVAVLEMTWDCNHACRFCSCPWENPAGSFSKNQELTIDEWKSHITHLLDLGVTSIAFTGGEPLLKKGIWDIIAHAARLNAYVITTRDNGLVVQQRPPKLFLISNGALINDEVLERCQKYGLHLSMSLPGLESYSYHTRSGSPDTILENFRRAKKYGLQTTVNIAVTRKNIGELYETIGEALLAGADSLLINRFLPGGRGLAFADELALDSAQVNRMLAIAEEVLAAANRFGHVGTELPKCILQRNDYRHLLVSNRCAAAQDFFVIGPDGHIRTCNHSPRILEHISEIEKVQVNPYWKKFALREYHPEMCQTCPDLFDCDGGCREGAHVLYGDPSAPDMLLAPDHR